MIDWRINWIDTINIILDFNKNKNENKNENDETLMPLDKDYDKTMIQNEIKEENDELDRIIQNQNKQNHLKNK